MAAARAVVWIEKSEPLGSGWDWRQEYLENAASIVLADVGRGGLLLFGPEITFRPQPHATFKFLFNGLELSTAEDLTP